MKKKVLIILGVVFSVILVLGLAYFIWLANFAKTYITVEIEESYLFFKSKYTVLKVEYDDIEDAKLEDTIYGNIQLDGVKFSNCEVGLYENEVVGEYYSFVEKKSKKSIVLKLDNPKVFPCPNMVVGFESLEKTTKLFEHIQGMIALEN